MWFQSEMHSCNYEGEMMTEVALTSLTFDK